MDLSDFFFVKFFDFFRIVGFIGELSLEFRKGHIAIRTLRPNRTVCPNVNRENFANDASFDLSDAAAHGVKRGTLVAHLRADAVFTSEVAKIASFADGARQRLLNVSVLAVPSTFPAVMQVCVWSGVLTTTASILSIISA